MLYTLTLKYSTIIVLLYIESIYLSYFYIKNIEKILNIE
jgi:hypothetical protein